MRDIKFRAWAIKGKGFIQGFNMFNYHSYFTKGLTPHLCRYDSEWTDGEYILEQYTGLKDKNSRDIYEGDIVNASIFCGPGNSSLCNPGKINQVCSIVFKKGQFTTDNCTVNEWVSKKLEIIGNIHRNPELLQDA